MSELENYEKNRKKGILRPWKVAPYATVMSLVGAAMIFDCINLWANIPTEKVDAGSLEGILTFTRMTSFFHIPILSRIIKISFNASYKSYFIGLKTIPKKGMSEHALEFYAKKSPCSLAGYKAAADMLGYRQYG
ncbi:hypothetical protein J4458_04825 [Candidatus Woesearchaeota archaeon]|nr:hypothetical protein [Candidatus Woesearchaeota archaeon]